MGQEISKVFLADSATLFRSGVKLLLAAFSDDLRFVEAGSLDQALDCLSKDPSHDLLLVDPNSRKMGGLVGIEKMRHLASGVPLVVLSNMASAESVRETIARGAKGYIPKNSTPEVLINALRLVLSGGIYLPPDLLDAMAAEPRRDGRGEASDGARRGSLTALTKRQRDVIAAMAEGKSNKEIARDLGMADGTVKIHVSNIFKALNVHNRTQAVLVARNSSERLMGGGILRHTAREGDGLADHRGWESSSSGQDATAESEGVDCPSAEKDGATGLGREGIAMAG